MRVSIFSKKISYSFFILFICYFVGISLHCIDRDSVVGTGRLEPFQMYIADGNGQIGEVGTKLLRPVLVKVTSENDRPVRDVVVKFSISNGNGVVTDTLPRTNIDGIASTTIKLGAKSDTVLIIAEVIGLKGSPVILVAYSTAAKATAMKIISGDNQSGTVGNQLPKSLVVFVKDLFGNPVRNVRLQFTAKGKVDPPNALTDSSGLARTMWTLDTISGKQFVNVQSSATADNILHFSANAKPVNFPATIEKVGGDNQVALQGEMLEEPLSIKLKDVYGNPISQFSNIEFRTLIGSSTISPSIPVSDSNGITLAFVRLSKTDTLVNIIARIPDDERTVQFSARAYVALFIDSLYSVNGIVGIRWQKNTNPNFLQYKILRAPNNSSNATSEIVGTISDESIHQFIDSTAVVGTQPVYKIQFIYSNGFSFTSYSLQITVR